MKISNRLKENDQHTQELLSDADDMVSNLSNITPHSFDCFKTARKSFEDKVQKIHENNQYVIDKLENLDK